MVVLRLLWTLFCFSSVSCEIQSQLSQFKNNVTVSLSIDCSYVLNTFTDQHYSNPSKCCFDPEESSVLLS